MRTQTEGPTGCHGHKRSKINLPLSNSQKPQRLKQALKHARRPGGSAYLQVHVTWRQFSPRHRAWPSQAKPPNHGQPHHSQLGRGLGWPGLTNLSSPGLRHLAPHHLSWLTSTSPPVSSATSCHNTQADKQQSLQASLPRRQLPPPE